MGKGDGELTVRQEEKPKNHKNLIDFWAKISYILSARTPWNKRGFYDMPMPKKPEELKKIGVSVGLTRLLVQAVDAARGSGESRSAYVAKILRKHLSAQVKKLEKELKN